MDFCFAFFIDTILGLTKARNDEDWSIRMILCTLKIETKQGMSSNEDWWNPGKPAIALKFLMCFV